MWPASPLQGRMQGWLCLTLVQGEMAFERSPSRIIPLPCSQSSDWRRGEAGSCGQALTGKHRELPALLPSASTPHLLAHSFNTSVCRLIDFFGEGKVKEILESQNRQRHSSSVLNQWGHLSQRFAFLQLESSVEQINICWCIILWSSLVFSIARLPFNKMTKHDFYKANKWNKTFQTTTGNVPFFFNPNTDLLVK